MWEGLTDEQQDAVVDALYNLMDVFYWTWDEVKKIVAAAIDDGRLAYTGEIRVAPVFNAEGEIIHFES